MFSEKLIIKNFGPFTEQVEFEFNKYSVIIGPQASGKSIVAKLITIFRNSRLVDYFEESLKNFNIAIFISKDTEIYYYSDIYSAKFFKGEIEFEINKNVENILDKNQQGDIDLLAEYLKQFKAVEHSIDSLKVKEISELKKKIALLIMKLGFDKEENIEAFGKATFIPHFKDSYYIPSERLFYAMFKESISSIIKADIPLPKVLIELGAMVEDLRNRNETNLLEFQQIRFEQRNDKLMISIGENKIPISFASSGIQSLYPILLICNSLKNKEIQAKREHQYISVAIEEPELNLFPQAQNEITKKIIESVNSTENVRVIITSHSPYILTTINNLLFKGKLKKLVESKDGTESEINFNDSINFEDISAYYIEDGKVDNLIDPQTQLINAKKLDAISYTINNEFTELMTEYRKLNA